MKQEQADSLFETALEECGNPAIHLATEKQLQEATGKRLGDKPYRFIAINGKGVMLAIKYRDWTAKTYLRYLYQAIAEILWPTIPYWKQRWYGLVMATPDEYPVRVQRPEGAQPRSRLLTLTKTQARRR